MVEYGAGNLRSVACAFQRAGADVVVSDDPSVVRAASLAVIAGVGHVESAARGIRPLEPALRARVAIGRPTLGICVGMQLLFEESEEGGCGLGLLSGRTRRLRAVTVPHMGWNTLSTNGAAIMDGLDGADVYFAHSYAVRPEHPWVVAATTDHDGPLVAAVQSDPLAGVQFHPERSGPAGARLIENVLRWAC